MQMHCPLCGMQITSQHINLANLVAKCHICHCVFSIREELATTESARERPAFDRSVPMPASFERIESQEHLVLRYRWLDISFALIACFALVWNSIMFFGFGEQIQRRGLHLADLAISGHALIGLILIYVAVAGALNRTVIELSSGNLSIRHSPIPWRGNLVIPLSEIQRVYCAHRCHRSKGRDFNTFALHAVLRDARMVKVAGGFRDPEAVLYLEQEIKKLLQRNYIPTESAKPV